jgi:outer membrane protein assembly factor BamE (lipoprotein component of BamABCDE complex)
MKKKISLTALSLAVLFLVNSCAPSTPATRIAKNPAMFESLSTSDKVLAQQGQIKRGMDKNGVLIAWGKPDGISAGDRNGKFFEQWIYTSLKPVYVNTFRTYAIYGYGRYGCDSFDLDYGPEVHYVQQTKATVEFDKNNKVSEWVTLR